MKHIAAYVLLLLSGNEAPTAEQVRLSFIDIEFFFTNIAFTGY